MSFPFRRDSVIGSSASDAFYIGRYWDERAGRVGPKMQMPGSEPIIIIGRNRSGKDAGIGNYNGLQLEGRSMFYIDPRGEAGAICGPHRRRLGPVYNVNAFGVLTSRHASYTPGYEDLESDGLNVLRGLDATSPMLFDDAASFAEAWIRLESKDPHWSVRARGLITGLTMAEVIDAAASGRIPTFANIRAVLTEADEVDGKTRAPLKGLVATAQRLVRQGHPQIASLLGGFTVDNEETRGVRATADGQTQAMLSQPMREDELKGGLALDELGNRPVTVFATMPHEFVKEGSIHSNGLRLWVSAALRSLYRPSPTICTFWLNEFAALGRLGRSKARSVWLQATAYNSLSSCRA